MEERAAPVISRRFAYAIYVVVSGAAIAGLVVNTTGLWGWRVDATSIGLIGVLLLVPIAEHLRKVKIGSLQAEFAEKVAYLDRRVTEFTDLATEPEPPLSPPTEIMAEPAEADRSIPSNRAIYRIVWVDDRPENNRLETLELRRRFDVVIATSTDEGLDEVGKSPDETAVITDAVRIEDGEKNVDAGLQLLSALKERYPAVPAYVFCGPSTVDNYAEPLERAGARLVTASFTELARKIRADGRVSFEAEVAAAIRALGEVEAQSMGVDFVLVRGNRRIGIEAKDFRRTPTAHAVDQAMALLQHAIASGGIGEGFVVAPRDVFVRSQRERAPEGVHLVSVAQLKEALDSQ